MTPRLRLTGDGDALARVLAGLRMPAARGLYRRVLRRKAEASQERSRRHYLSGQALRVVTGRLRRSLEIDRAKGRADHEALIVGSRHPGAGALHFGWPSKNLRARPFLFPAISELRERVFPEIWVEELERQEARLR